MNRRQFFKNSLLGTVGLAVLGTLETTKSWAAELVKIKKDGSADHPQALAMGYVADLKKARKDPKKSGLDLAKKTSDNQDCGRCQFYTGKAGSKTGPCTLFGGALVESKGSCNTWVPKVKKTK